jgi:hypothetical protein
VVKGSRSYGLMWIKKARDKELISYPFLYTGLLLIKSSYWHLIPR